MNKAEETRKLEGAMEDNRAFDYGTANLCEGNFLEERTPSTTSHGHSCSLNMSSIDEKMVRSGKQFQVAPSNKLCVCREKDGVCYCGEKKHGIQLEPWSHMKSIALIFTMAFLAVWVLVIASLGAVNKL